MAWSPRTAQGETAWASHTDIEALFGIDQSCVSLHIRNILRAEEVVAESNMQQVHIAGSDRPVTLYSLDVVLAVGYRANSARAIAFRRWATEASRATGCSRTRRVARMNQERSL